MSTNIEPNDCTAAIKRRIFRSEYFTGLFCIGALVILFYFTVMIKGKDYLFPNREMTTLQVSFPNAGNLIVNDKVKVIGVDMGYVKKISLVHGANAIEVQLALNQKIPIHSDYQISIQNASIFGGAYINIVPGTQTQNQVNCNQVLKGDPPVDLIGEASELITRLREDEARLRKDLLDDKFLGDVKTTLAKIGTNSENFNKICDDILRGKGTIGKAFTNEQLYNDATATFKNMNALTVDVQQLTSELRNGKGTLPLLIRDDSAYQSLVASLNSIQTLSKKLANAKGSFSYFMNDNGKLYNTLEQTLANMDVLTKDLREGKGSLGKVIKDDALYDELLDTVRQLRVTIEDFREIAPVTTFSSIALGAL